MKERPAAGWRITHGVQRRVRGGPLKSARVGLNKLAGTFNPVPPVFNVINNLNLEYEYHFTCNVKIFISMIRHKCST